MGRLLLGVDVGTSSAKGVLIQLDGTVVARATVQHQMDVPRPGWAEQDADAVWWSSLVGVLDGLFEGVDRTPDEVASVGISAIGPCLVPLDGDGRALRPGILYGIDTRATREIEDLEHELGVESIRASSRMDLSSQAVGPKILWYRRNEPELWERTRAITTASSYLVRRLSGRLVIDHHQAAHYLPLYDPDTRSWSDAYEDLVAPAALLPELAWCDEIAGEVTPDAAAMTGLRPGTPVVVGGVDALLEALSVGVHRPGELMIMYGSTAFFILVTERGDSRPPLWSLPGALEGTSVLAGGMATTGAATRWFVDLLEAGIDAYGPLFEAAGRLAPGADGLLALPYLSGERTPIDDPSARGVIAGLSLAHGREHLFRALLEGVAFGVRQNLAVMGAPTSPIERCVAVGGGTASDIWTQIVSDVTGRAQQIPVSTIGAAFGDAFVAGLGIGAVALDDIDRWNPSARTIEPDPATREAYDTHFALFEQLYEQTRPTVHSLVASAEEAAR